MTTTIEAHESSRVATDSLTPPTSRTEKRPQYLFIHTVRFWAMVGIVLMHAVHELEEMQPIPLFQKSLMFQVFKFGTIGFFIISGFLIGDRLPKSNPFAYLRRRANRLLPAWALWWALDTLNVAKRDLFHAHRNGLGAFAVFGILRSAALWVLIMTPVWFVPNLLIALTCLILLRRWIDDLRLGAFFLALNLFYSVNVYTVWIPSRHTEALLAFVFYLWLGAWCARHKEQVLPWIEARSTQWLAIWACVAAGFAIVEAYILSGLKNPDIFNSLRFCNQIYSLLIVILLVRIKRRTWPAFINVAGTTYGIYHSHPIVLGFTGFVATKAGQVLLHGRVFGPMGILFVWLFVAASTYFICLKVVSAFASKPGLAWIVGAADVPPLRWNWLTALARNRSLVQPDIESAAS